MRLDQIFEDNSFEDSYDPHEEEHFADLAQTGFYGKAGAGVVFLAKDTGRLLLAHRSKDVEEPHTWGNWGGALNPGEDPKVGAAREARQEAGASNFQLIPLYVFTSGSFRYSNFLAIVEHEFTPSRNWETQGFRWCEWGNWPKPLHFGLVSLFNDGPSVEKIKAAGAR